MGIGVTPEEGVDRLERGVERHGEGCGKAWKGVETGQQGKGGDRGGQGAQAWDGDSEVMWM